MSVDYITAKRAPPFQGGVPLTFNSIIFNIWLLVIIDSRVSPI